MLNKTKILRKVIAKLAKLDESQASDIIFSIIDKEDVLQPNFSKTIKVDKEQHQKLRKLYDQAPVDKLYTYSLDKFGFTFQNLRFDVDPIYLNVKKIKKI